MEGRPWKKGIEAQHGHSFTQTPVTQLKSPQRADTPGACSGAYSPVLLLFTLIHLISAVSCCSPRIMLNTTVTLSNWPESVLVSDRRGDTVLSGGSRS